MSVRELVQAALLGALEMAVFTALSSVLYVEAVTLTIVCVAVCMPKKIAVLSSVCFCVLNMLLVQAITPWSLMYLMIYPTYSLIVGSVHIRTKKKAALITGILSFLTGQLLQIPWMLFSKILAAGYLLMGLQTSLIQGAISAALAWFLFDPVCRILKRVN